MADFLGLPLQQLAALMAQRELLAETIVQACIERIQDCEEKVRAWQFFDPALALAQARALDRRSYTGALHGIPLGVKDLMDTADMPTTYGSRIYAGHRPVADAACVAASRAAGAIVMGKTVTTEFAYFQPGPTVNPHSRDKPRTPGGSSSGSAAAVAAGMVPVAFGTQTAGSIIRPAAYCGVVGYKPTFGTLPVAGVKTLSPSLDTVGVLARTVGDAAFIVQALTRLPLMPDTGSMKPLRVGICPTPYWDRANADTRQAMATAARLLQDSGAITFDTMVPAACQELNDIQLQIMAYEMTAAFSHETATRSQDLSPALSALMTKGSAISGAVYFHAQAQAAAARHAAATLFDSVDVLLAPSAEGEAPEGLASTGDPVFNRMWTLLGNPCVHVPLGKGGSGMPVGVTIVGKRWDDAQTLAAARILESCAA